VIYDPHLTDSTPDRPSVSEKDSSSRGKLLLPPPPSASTAVAAALLILGAARYDGCLEGGGHNSSSSSSSSSNALNLSMLALAFELLCLGVKRGSGLLVLVKPGRGSLKQESVSV